MSKRIFIAVLFVALSVVFFLITKKTTAPTTTVPTPTPYSLPTINNWQGLIPGKTTHEEVVEKMGQPLSTKGSASSQTLLYPSKNEHWDNEVQTVNNSLVFVREYIFKPDEVSYKRLSAGMLEKPTILYGPDHTSGFVLYAYPQSGIAYYINTYRDTVYEVWRFPADSIEKILTGPQFEGFNTSPVVLPE
jgi:hypothetical protein